MKYAATISILFVVAGCASAPSMRVVAETECVQEVAIKTMISDFGDGAITGCGKRAYTGKFFMTYPRREVSSRHIINSNGTLVIAPEYRHLYERAS